MYVEVEIIDNGITRGFTNIDKCDGGRHIFYREQDVRSVLTLTV